MRAGRPCAAHVVPLVVLVCAGCGSSEPPPHAPEPAPVAAPAPVKAPEPEMQVEGQLGSIDPDAVQYAFNQLQPALQRCHAEGLKRIRYLGGDVKIALRIAQDGTVRTGYLEQSTLGDHDVEACMIHAWGDMTWPRPIGGEAEVQGSFGFDPPASVRPPAPWTSDTLAVTLVEHQDKIKACKGKVQGEFKATAYVVQGAPKAPRSAKASGKGKRPTPKDRRRGSGPSAKETNDRGHILAVGIAPPGPDAAEPIDCLVEVLREMKVPSPGRYPAKVTFGL